MPRTSPNKINEKEIEAINALKKYKVFALTPERRILLGKTLTELEKKKISLKQAKERLREKNLLNEKIIKALKTAAGSS